MLHGFCDQFAFSEHNVSNNLLQMLLKCLTVDQPIQQALLSSMSNEREECEDYIIVVTDVNVHFFSFHGQDISRALPFHGAHVWSLNPGLLIHVSYFNLH